MQVVMIGSGNVAVVIAKLLHNKGYTIEQVYSQTFANADALAKQVDAAAIGNMAELNPHADVYIIAVSDKAIEPLVSTLRLPNKLVIHTAGSVSKEVLRNVSERHGVLYPIQSVRKNMDENTIIPFLIDGNTKEVITDIENIAKSISSKTALGNDEARLKLHVAAVFACNFVNYMYLQSASYCQNENIDFSLLQPLIEETATRLRTNHPAAVFTGPAVRGDSSTINKHLELLNNYPDLQELYNTITNNIINTKKPTI